MELGGSVFFHFSKAPITVQHSLDRHVVTDEAIAAEIFTSRHGRSIAAFVAHDVRLDDLFGSCCATVGTV